VPPLFHVLFIFIKTWRDRVIADDETRFLSIRADDTRERTHDVIIAQFSSEPVQHLQHEMPVWHEAIRLLCTDIPRFSYPNWFDFLAGEIPPGQARSSRDAARFLSLLQAVALCRCQSEGWFDESPKRGRD
jgi:hypothetical protein